MQMTFLQFARIEAAIVAVWLDLGVYIEQYYCTIDGLGREGGINSADKNYSPEMMRREGDLRASAVLTLQQRLCD